MIDWSKSMQQTFEYYIVDPGTWKNSKLINTVKSSSISWDYEADTLGSASISVSEELGECYVRIYLVANQNGTTEKRPLGTFLVQTPTTSFDGKSSSITLDAYSPLIELKEKQPPIGYSILKGANIMENAYNLVEENIRAPISEIKNEETLFDDFVANTDESWLSFNSSLIANADYIFDLDEMGRVLFAPKQDVESLQPVWTYSDDNSSLLYPSITLDRDLYGIPNVVEVICSSEQGGYYAKAINDEPSSPISTISRGREITYRVVNPDFLGVPSDHQVTEYATELLKSLSTLEYTITYTHGYCPARIGDCIRLSYAKAGLLNVKARIISQTIKCEPGCPVTEKAVFTKRLWR